MLIDAHVIRTGCSLSRQVHESRFLFILAFGKRVSRRANCRTSIRVCCYLHARYLSAGNRGRNFVSMGIVWQQVGKISTHRLPTAPVSPFPVPFPRSGAASRCTVTQFRFRLPSSDSLFDVENAPASDCRANLRFP